MIRLFVGLELPDDIKDQVYSLRGGVPMARWVDKEKLHLNLRFLGNIQENTAQNFHRYSYRWEAGRERYRHS